MLKKNKKSQVAFKRDCSRHGISPNTSDWTIMWHNVSKIMGDLVCPCPLCVLEELSQLDNNVGKKAELVIEAYNQLCKAEDGFYHSLDKKIEDIQCNTSGAIDSLDLSDQVATKAIIRKPGQAVILKELAYRPSPIPIYSGEADMDDVEACEIEESPVDDEDIPF